LCGSTLLLAEEFWPCFPQLSIGLAINETILANISRLLEVCDRLEIRRFGFIINWTEVNSKLFKNPLDVVDVYQMVCDSSSEIISFIRL